MTYEKDMNRCKNVSYASLAASTRDVPGTARHEVRNLDSNVEMIALERSLRWRSVSCRW